MQKVSLSYKSNHPIQQSDYYELQVNDTNLKEGKIWYSFGLSKELNKDPIFVLSNIISIAKKIIDEINRQSGKA